MSSSCYAPNSLPFLYPTRVQPAGQAASPVHTAPSSSQWLSWLAPQREAYVMSLNRPYAGESREDYARRIKSIVASYTTSSIASFPRAAGGTSGNLTITNDEAGIPGTETDTGTGKSSSGGSSGGGMSDAQVTALAGTTGRILGASAEMISRIVTSGNQVERDRIAADARIRITELQTQANSSSIQGDASASSAIQEQIDALRGLAQAALHPPAGTTILGMKPMTAAIVGGGLLVLAIGGVYYATRSRTNPVLYTRSKPNRWNRKTHMKPTKFVRASKLKK